MRSFKIPRTEDLKELALYLKEKIEVPTIILLFGPVGVGKTTLTKAIAKEFGLNPLKIKSPTFTLINSYLTSENISFHHLDLYRIEKIEEFFEENLKEILENKESLIIIEWPEQILPLLKHYSHFKVIKIQAQYIKSEETRLLTIEEV